METKEKIIKEKMKMSEWLPILITVVTFAISGIYGYASLNNDCYNNSANNIRIEQEFHDQFEKHEAKFEKYKEKRESDDEKMIKSIKFIENTVNGINSNNKVVQLQLKYITDALKVLAKDVKSLK